MGAVAIEAHRSEQDDAFRSMPGTRDPRSASTPGRAQMRRSSRLMAKRVVAKWDDQEADRSKIMETPERPRR